MAVELVAVQVVRYGLHLVGCSQLHVAPPLVASPVVSAFMVVMIPVMTPVLVVMAPVMHGHENVMLVTVAVMVLVMMAVFAILDHNVVRVLLVVIVQHERIFCHHYVRTLFASGEHRPEFAGKADQQSGEQQQ